MRVSKYCILFKSCKKRVDLYNRNLQKMPDLKVFDAIDSITNYNNPNLHAIALQYLSEEYIKYTELEHGKLGCNLSHILLLKHFIENTNTDWMLVIEDDTELNNYSDEIIDHIISKCEAIDSHFVQLYTHPRFVKRQCRMYEKLGYGIYRMMPQLGTLAYLISRKGAQTILNDIPISRNIDVYFSQCINKLQSIAYINNIFTNKGNIGKKDNSELGSIIYYGTS